MFLTVESLVPFDDGQVVLLFELRRMCEMNVSDVQAANYPFGAGSRGVLLASRCVDITAVADAGINADGDM